MSHIRHPRLWSLFYAVLVVGFMSFFLDPAFLEAFATIALFVGLVTYILVLYITLEERERFLRDIEHRLIHGDEQPPGL